MNVKYYKYELNKDNINDFYFYCKTRNDSTTYETNNYGLSKVQQLVDVFNEKGVVYCRSCNEEHKSISIIANNQDNNFKICCSNCNSEYITASSEAVSATIKWYADVINHNESEEENKENNTKRENEKMRNARENKGFNLRTIFAGLEFGLVKGNDFKMSIYGIAFKNTTGKLIEERTMNGIGKVSPETKYVAYDKSKGELIDVDCMNFEANGMIMKMPVAMSQVAVGDVIIHQGSPVVVKAIREDKNLEVIAPGVAEIKIVMPIKNMFGFNFYTKVMPLLDMNTFATGANDDNPFGTMMPMMLMSSMMDTDSEMDPMTMMLMMNSMNGETIDMQSMLPLMMLSGDNNMSDIMPLLMMQGMADKDMDMNMILPLMMMNKNKDMNPMMMLMMMNGGLFGKKENKVDIEALKQKLYEEFHKTEGNQINE